MKTPDPHLFKSGRDFAACLGLTPREHSTAGKARPGRITRAGAAQPARGRRDRGDLAGAPGRREQPVGWLMALLERKPAKLAAVALANKMARIAWKRMASGERYAGASRAIAAP